MVRKGRYPYIEHPGREKSIQPTAPSPVAMDVRILRLAVYRSGLCPYEIYIGIVYIPNFQIWTGFISVSVDYPSMTFSLTRIRPADIYRKRDGFLANFSRIVVLQSVRGKQIIEIIAGVPHKSKPDYRCMCKSFLPHYRQPP